LPLFGNLLDYRRDNVDLFWRGFNGFGTIFSLRLGPKRAVVLIGPEHHKFFFSQVDKILSVPEMYGFVIPMFGPVLNAARDEQVRRQQLSLLHSAFQGNRVTGHVQAMVRETLAWMETLGSSGRFEIFDAFAALGMNIAASAFMGAEIRRRMGEFVPLYLDLARGMDFFLPPNLPLPRFRRRDQARRKLTELIRPIIRERKAAPGRNDDFLQMIIQGDYPREGGDPDETIVGMALMMVFTAYIATSAQTCWSLIQLLQHPMYLAELREEQDGLVGRSDAIDVDALNRMHRLDWALKETQRMHPVMSHFARYTAVGYQLGGYHIPRGWLTMVSPAVSHRLPELFSQPHVYDPHRFAPSRAEDHRQPFSLIGFGAGVYRCPGARFGVFEMKCAISLLLERYDLELIDPHPRRNYEMGVLRPAPPCMVRYVRRAAATPRRRAGAVQRSVEIDESVDAAADLARSQMPIDAHREQP
jgi:sterol 14-demethylase